MLRYLSPRRRRRDASEALVVAAVEYLSALAASRGNGRPLLEAPSRARPAGDATARRPGLPCNPGRAVRDYLPMPRPSDEFPGGTLLEILRAKNAYDLEDASHTATCSPDKLNVLKGAMALRDFVLFALIARLELEATFFSCAS